MGREVKSLVFPALNTTDHLFDLSAKARQIPGPAVGPVAMRPVAVHDKQCVNRVTTQVSLVYFPVRQAGRAREVARFEGLRAAHVSKTKSELPSFMASWTSQQSVSNVRSCSKCVRASIGLAAPTSLTNEAAFNNWVIGVLLSLFSLHAYLAEIG